MSVKRFKRTLEKRNYPYTEKDGRIVIGVESYNVDLRGIKSIPPRITFENGGVVILSTKEIPGEIEFRNGSSVELDPIKTISSSVKFYNKGDVYLGIPGNKILFNPWEGNIEGINPKRLLNKMVELGLFDRRR